MRDITLEELLEAGCHFGHQVTRQNPKARDFVFEARDGIHIIDLAKTKEGLDEALVYLKQLASQEGSTLLVVGTKRQATPIVEEKVKGSGLDSVYSVTKRWIGGTLTNTPAMHKNFAKLKDLQSKLKSDEAKEPYTKKEIGQWEKELAKLNSFYSGIVDMKSLPSTLFIVDTHMENLAVREANRMGIPVVGIVDTNADPDPIQYVIPANDDAVGSLELLIGAVMDAWREGKADMGKEQKETTPKKQETSAVTETKEAAVVENSGEPKEKPNEAKEKPKAKAKAVASNAIDSEKAAKSNLAKKEKVNKEKTK